MMKVTKKKSFLKRSGLTLVELIVVMLILVALAGLLVPMLPSMLTRGHTSTCATNIGELTKALGEYQAMYGVQPYDFDSLTDGSSKMINYLAGSGLAVNGVQWPAGQGNGAGNSEVTLYTLTGAGTRNSSGVADTNMLTGVGITSVQPMVATAGTATTAWAANPIGTVFDPTFNYYLNPPSTTPGISSAGSGVPIAAGVALAVLDPTASTAAAARAASLNLSPTGLFVVLGVGQRCSLVGKCIQTAPVHFGDQPALNPEYGYQRLVAIYQIADSSAGITMTQARLVGVAPIHDTGIGNTQDELQNAYQLQTGGS